MPVASTATRRVKSSNPPTVGADSTVEVLRMSAWVIDTVAAVRESAARSARAVCTATGPLST